MADNTNPSRQEYILITLTVFLAGYLLNVVWESLHWVWFYVPSLPVPAFTYITHIASLGDCVWIIILYWLTAAQARDATWIQRLTKANIAIFAGLGLIAATGSKHGLTLPTHGPTAPPCQNSSASVSHP
jgi:hypothetical protein